MTYSVSDTIRKGLILLLLYHVSSDLKHSGLFTPGIPSIRLENENTTINRVCMAFTIEGCLTGMPRGGERLKETLKETDGYLLVHTLDTAKAKMSISEMELPFSLYTKGLVLDALMTDEVWVKKPFRAHKKTLIRLNAYEETLEDSVPEWVSPKPAECPVITRIENITYEIVEENKQYENGKSKTKNVHERLIQSIS